MHCEIFSYGHGSVAREAKLVLEGGDKGGRGSSTPTQGDGMVFYPGQGEFFPQEVPVVVTSLGFSYLGLCHNSTPPPRHERCNSGYSGAPGA